MSKVRLFLITNEGEYNEIPFQANQFKSDQVYLLLNEDEKDIWIWKGKNARIRNKFLGARAATELRNDIGFQYKVHSIDEGETDPDFQALVDNGEPTTKPLTVTERVPPPRTTHKPTTRSKKTKTEKPPSYRQLTDVVPPPTLSTENSTKTKEPPPSLIETNVKAKSADTVSKKKPIPSAASSISPSPLEISVDSVIEKLDTIEPLDGYSRELVIIGHACYAVSEKSVRFLGEERIERRLERLKNMPEGIFFAEEYTPRVVVEDGKVIAIEFWKEAKLVSEQLKGQMTRSLDELTKFFKMIEEGEQEEP